MPTAANNFEEQVKRHLTENDLIMEPTEFADYIDDRQNLLEQFEESVRMQLKSLSFRIAPDQFWQAVDHLRGGGDFDELWSDKNKKRVGIVGNGTAWKITRKLESGDLDSIIEFRRDFCQGFDIGWQKFCGSIKDQNVLLKAHHRLNHIMEMDWTATTLKNLNVPFSEIDGILKLYYHFKRLYVKHLETEYQGSNPLLTLCYEVELYNRHPDIDSETVRQLTYLFDLQFEYGFDFNFEEQEVLAYESWRDRHDRGESKHDGRFRSFLRWLKCLGRTSDIDDSSAHPQSDTTISEPQKPSV